MIEYIYIFEIVGIILGLLLALLGLFHQLIVGGAVSMIKDSGAVEARIFIMTWVSQGAFMSFCGLLPAVLLFFYGAMLQSVQTVMLLTGVALILLSIHVFVSGFKSHIKPVQLGAVIQLFYGFYLLSFVIISHTIL